jgi:hypothetical protein
MKKRIVIAVIFIAISLWGFTLLNSAKTNSLTVEQKTGASGRSNYIIIYKNATKIDFEITRPDTKDSNILLCIPGAFTTLDNYIIDGLYICKGVAGNKDKVNRTLGGGIKIINGNCNMFNTYYGRLLTDSLLSSIETQKGSFFQQICMIDSGKIPHFKEDVLTYRRGIAIFKNGKTAIIESISPVNLKTFATDLLALGVQNLIYTDMGGWDEGWYRNPDNGNIVSMGSSHAQTMKQSNWVVFKR